jgi:hypothetical protein
LKYAERVLALVIMGNLLVSLAADRKVRSFELGGDQCITDKNREQWKDKIKSVS